MRKLIFLAALLWLAPGHADLERCSDKILQNPKTRGAVDFLRPLAGRYSLGQCIVELQICAQSGATDGDPVVGDLLVTDRLGNRFYVLLDFDLAETDRTAHVVVTSRQRAHYESIERIPDSLNGRTEAYRLEIVKSGDLSRPVQLELGVYTSKLKAEYPFLPAKKSYWIHCDEAVNPGDSARP